MMTFLAPVVASAVIQLVTLTSASSFFWLLSVTLTSRPQGKFRIRIFQLTLGQTGKATMLIVAETSTITGHRCS